MENTNMPDQSADASCFTQTLATLIAAHFKLTSEAAKLVAGAFRAEVIGTMAYGCVIRPENTLTGNVAWCHVREAGLLAEDEPSAGWVCRETNTLWAAHLKREHVEVVGRMRTALLSLVVDTQNETLGYASDRARRGLRIC